MLGNPFINDSIDCLTDYFLCNLWNLFRRAFGDTLQLLDTGVGPGFQFNGIQVPKEYYTWVFRTTRWINNNTVDVGWSIH